MVWDLYGDDGSYYFAQTRDGLPAQVAAHNNQGDSLFGREVEAAVYAAKGDLDTARQKMAGAAGKPGVISERDDKELTDWWIWSDSIGALKAGAGNPVVREGVLRLMSTLPHVAVTKTSTDGRPTLALTDTEPPVKAGPKSSSGETQTVTIDADTGVPISFHSGQNKSSDDVKFEVSRVTLADVAAGKF
ncbi:hypothetical protein [Kutzneria kofuensis]|uniref:Uncharacterized protein n=1 Tax=Kutzneria kofuensis TaxID=103725 RepID=A0A7W9KNY5_9PSEU|nr:hypothetical protein [Kutzneria kofuensis]MBB5896041.1 hypothetical protein [Kutzneria kofuensis]